MKKKNLNKGTSKSSKVTLNSKKSNETKSRSGNKIKGEVTISRHQLRRDNGSMSSTNGTTTEK